MATLQDIANKSGFNISTVSRALKGDKEIAAETRAKITEIAKEMGYKPRRSASASRQNVIGVVIPDMHSEFFTNMLAVIDRELCAIGCIPFYAIFNYDDRTLIHALDLCKTNQVEGVIAIGLNAATETFLSQYVAVNTFPVVAVAPIGEYAFLNCVKLDIRPSLTRAISTFLKKGKHKLALATDYMNYSFRKEDFDFAFLSNGLKEGDYQVVLTEERFEEGGYKSMKQMLLSRTRPDAILSGYDRFAIGQMRAIKEAGVRIPEDIAICAIDNISMSEYLHPSLSSVASPIDEMLAIAVKYLLDAIKRGDNMPIYNTVLKSRLILRESV